VSATVQVKPGRRTARFKTVIAQPDIGNDSGAHLS